VVKIHGNGLLDAMVRSNVSWEVTYNKSFAKLDKLGLEKCKFLQQKLAKTND